MANEKGVCAFCNRGDVGADVVGETLQAEGLTVHHHCLYFSSGLEQKGEEDEGIQGFLATDILKEIKRGQRCRLKCFVCGQRGAYIGCANKRCRKTGHFPCLNEQGFLFQFWGSFSAYCQKHRPTQPPLDFQSPRRLNCSICVCQVPSAPSFDVLYSPCCKAVLHRECIQKFALSAGGYFFRCPLCNNNDTFVKEMLRMGISIPERDATWESCGQFNDLYEVRKQCTSEVCVCPKGRSFSSKHGKFRLLCCKSCGRYIAHESCSDNHLIRSSECRDCVLASTHNTPQTTPTSYTPASGTANKGTSKTTSTTPTPTSKCAPPTAPPITTPSVLSNVGQMLACSCAVCHAKRGTAHGEVSGPVMKGGGGSTDLEERSRCGTRHNLPNDSPRGGVALAPQRGATLCVGEKGTVPVSKKRCLEYPSDDLRPKMDKPLSAPPPPSSDPGTLESPSQSHSKITIATLPSFSRSTRSAAFKATPLPVSDASVSPSHLPLEPSGTSAPPAPLLSSANPSLLPIMEIPLSRTLTYSQVMDTKATSCAKHVSNGGKHVSNGGKV